MVQLLEKKPDHERVNEAIKYIMHTSIGAKLFICKLDYCLKVDEPSTNAKKMGYVYVFALNFQYNLRQAIKIL